MKNSNASEWYKMSNNFNRRPQTTYVPALALICAAAISWVSADGTDVGTAAQLDPTLKNIKYIENKVIPDVKSLPNERPRAEGIDAEKWQQVQRFMEDGMPLLELYGYKPKRGEQMVNISMIARPSTKITRLIPVQTYTNECRTKAHGSEEWRMCNLIALTL